MAANISTLDACRNIQVNLLNLARENYGAFRREPTGLLDGLVSARNTNGFEAVPIQSANGKILQVNVRYAKDIDSAAQVQDARVDQCVNDCAADPYDDQQVVLDCTKSIKVCMSAAELRTFCEGKDQVQNERVTKALNALFKEMDKDLVNKYVAQVGDFYGAGGLSVLPKAVNMLRTTTDGGTRQDADGLVEIKQDLGNLGLSDQPIMVGYGNLNRFASYEEIACCNEYGQDLSGYLPFDYFKDIHMDTELGTPNNVFAWNPGAIQFVTAVENVGDLDEMHEHYAHTTFVDPMTGIRIDMDLKYDDCARTWTWGFTSQYTLWTQPEVFQAADPRFGTNNTFYYRADKV